MVLLRTLATAKQEPITVTNQMAPVSSHRPTTKQRQKLQSRTMKVLAAVAAVAAALPISAAAAAVVHGFLCCVHLGHGLETAEVAAAYQVPSIAIQWAVCIRIQHQCNNRTANILERPRW